MHGCSNFNKLIPQKPPQVEGLFTGLVAFKMQFHMYCKPRGAYVRHVLDGRKNDRFLPALRTSEAI